MKTETLNEVIMSKVRRSEGQPSQPSPQLVTQAHQISDNLAARVLNKAGAAFAASVSKEKSKMLKEGRVKEFKETTRSATGTETAAHRTLSSKNRAA